MKKAIALFGAAGLLLALGTSVRAAEDRKLNVVTTMSTFAALAKEIGGDRVEVSYVASPRFNPHFIEPKPSDVRRVQKADLLIHAGLDLEAWRGPLLVAAGNPRLNTGGEGELDLSKGIDLLEVPDRPLSRAEGDIHLFGNPHYWTDPENAKIMARDIADKLAEMDPAHAEEYRGRLEAFLKKLDSSITRWRQELAGVKGKEVIAYHNEWPYLARFAGIRIEKFLEPKPGIPPGPKHLGELETQMKEQGIHVIVQSTYFLRSSADALAKRIGAKVVILAQNVGEVPGTEDYFSWMDYNVKQLAQTLGGGA